MPLSSTIASRFLLHNPLQTIFIALGISVGVAVQMFVGLLIDSLQSNLINQTIGSSAHISIYPKEANALIDRPENLLNLFKDTPGITKVVPVVESNGFVINEEDETIPVLFKGLPVNGDDLFQIKSNMVTGLFYKNSKEIVLGSELADELGISTGDTVEILNGSGTAVVYTISGLFSTGVSAIDGRWIVGDTLTVQNYFGYYKEINYIAIQVREVFDAKIVQSELLKRINLDEFKVENWIDTNQQLLTALSSQSQSSFMIQFFVLVAVIIAITSILSISVMQKSRQIGILKAIGLTNFSASSIFIQTSFVIGFLGSTIGALLGFMLFFGFISGTGIFEPVIRIPYVLLTWLGTIAASTLAGIIPARKSAKLDPISIIQNE